MVYDYLAAMGYTDPARVQQEAANSDLSCLIRFYSGEFCRSLSSGQPLNRKDGAKGFYLSMTSPVPLLAYVICTTERAAVQPAVLFCGST